MSKKNFDPINEYITNKKSRKNILKTFTGISAEFFSIILKLLNNLWMPLIIIFAIMAVIGMCISRTIFLRTGNQISAKTEIPEKNDKSYERYIPDFERNKMPEEILNESWDKTIK